MYSNGNNTTAYVHIKMYVSHTLNQHMYILRSLYQKRTFIYITASFVCIYAYISIYIYIIINIYRERERATERVCVHGFMWLFVVFQCVLQNDAVYVTECCNVCCRVCCRVCCSEQPTVCAACAVCRRCWHTPSCLSLSSRPALPRRRCHAPLRLQCRGS